MAMVRLPLVLRGVPARLGAVLLLAGAVGTWTVWPERSLTGKPPALALEGKHLDRLAFAGDETDIPVRESRIYDTIAMFAQPQAQPRAWSESAVAATVQEAGIRPIPSRPLPAPRLAVAKPDTARPDTARPIRTASAEPRGAAKAQDSGRPLNVLGWDLPGSEYLPSRGDAARVATKVGDRATALGTGTARVVSRTATALGDGVASAGNALADTLGLN